MRVLHLKQKSKLFGRKITHSHWVVYLILQLFFGCSVHVLFSFCSVSISKHCLSTITEGSKPKLSTHCVDLLVFLLRSLIVLLFESGQDFSQKMLGT